MKGVIVRHTIKIHPPFFYFASSPLFTPSVRTWLHHLAVETGGPKWTLTSGFCLPNPSPLVASDLPKISIDVQLMFCFKMVDWVYLLNYLSPTPLSKSTGFRKHRMKHIFSSVENGKLGRYIYSRDFYKLLEAIRGIELCLLVNWWEGWSKSERLQGRQECSLCGVPQSGSGIGGSRPEFFLRTEAQRGHCS